MKTEQTYGVEINDLRPGRKKTIKLTGYKTSGEASDIAWQLMETISDITLSIENQFYRYLASFNEDVIDSYGNNVSGQEAVVIMVTNPDGSYFKNL